MRIKVKIPQSYKDTQEEMNELYRQYLFAYAILEYIIPASEGTLFTSKNIEKICVKGVKGDRIITQKQTSLLALLYILCRNNYKSFKVDDINNNAKLIFGYPFTVRSEDISVWLTDVSKYIKRDKKANKTVLISKLESILNASFNKGYFNPTIILTDKEVEVKIDVRE